MAATRRWRVRASTRNPAGGSITASRWLIQICCAPRDAGENRRLAAHRSRASRGRTRPSPRAAPRRPAAAPSTAARSRCRAPPRPARRWPGPPWGCRGRTRSPARPEIMMPLPRGQLRRRRLRRAHLRVDSRFPDLAGNQVAVLPPSIQDRDLGRPVQAPNCSRKF